jgi:hypothetical protein
MHYTLRQMRDTVGLTLETYRHWKKVLPSLANKRGREPCYSVGDIVAASILFRLTETAGVRVGHLKDVSVEIFDLCNCAAWAALEGTTLAIDFERRTCEVARSTASAVKPPGLVLLCPLDPILATLRYALLRDQDTEDQAELRFPPTPLGAPAEGRRKRA